MILDNVNPDDLFPTEKKGPSVLGMIEYNVQGQTKFEGAFIATNERLIMNVDMNGQFYYRNIRYDEINQIHFDGSDIICDIYDELKILNGKRFDPFKVTYIK